MMTVKPKTAALALAFALSTASSFANQGLGTDFSAQTAPVQGSGPSARFITDSRKPRALTPMSKPALEP